MASDAPQKDLDIATIGLVAAVGTLTVLLTVILLQAYFYRSEDRAFQEAYAQPVLEVKRVKSEQLQLLQGTGSVPQDPAQSTIRTMSIERAMDLVVREGARAWPAPAMPPAAAVAPAAEAGASAGASSGARGAPIGRPATSAEGKPPARR